MSPRWFFSKDGKAHGPISSEELVEKFKDGSLVGTSHLFKEGEAQWKRAAEYSELQSNLHPKSEAPPSSPVLHGEWVALAKSLEDTQVGKPRFIQKGPYSKAQILELIQTGELHWTDHVWTSGFTAWARISSLKDFNVGLSFEKEAEGSEPQKTSEGPVLELNSHLQSESTSPMREELPEEVTQPGLLTNAPAAEPVEEIKSVATPAASEKAAASSSVTGSVTEESVSIVPRFWTRRRMALYGGTGATLGLILVVSLLLSGPSTEKPSAPEPSREVASGPSPIEAPVVSAPAPAPAPVAPAPVVEPAFVRILPLKLESPAPQIAFETNVPIGEALKVSLVGKKGKILELARFEKSVQIAREQNIVPTLNLTKWNLPAGSYLVTVESKGVIESQEVFIGLKNRQFQSKLDQHNKRIQLQAQAERRELLDFAKRARVLASKLEKGYEKNRRDPKGWQAFLRVWGKELKTSQSGLVGKYKVENSNRYVNSKTIAGAKALIAEFKEASGSMDASIKSKRAPAKAQSLSDIRERIKKLEKALN